MRELWRMVKCKLYFINHDYEIVETVKELLPLEEKDRFSIASEIKYKITEHKKCKCCGRKKIFTRYIK